MIELKNINALRDEVDHLEEAANLLAIVENCFDSYYDFRNFVEKNARCLTDEDKNRLASRIDRYFNFDDSE